MAQHIRPEMLTLVWTDLTFGKRSQTKNRKNPKTKIYLYLLIVVHTFRVSTTTHHTQPYIVNLPNTFWLIIFLFFDNFLLLLRFYAKSNSLLSSSNCS